MKSLEVHFLIGPKDDKGAALPKYIEIDVISQHLKRSDYLNIFEYSENHWKIRTGGTLFNDLGVLDSIEITEDSDGCPTLTISRTGSSISTVVPVRLLVEPDAKSNYIRLDLNASNYWTLSMSSKLFADHTQLRGIYFRRDGGK